MPRSEDLEPLLLFGPQGYKCLECESVLYPNNVVTHIRKRHKFWDEKYVLKHRTKDVSNQPYVKLRAFFCQRCNVGFGKRAKYEIHCENRGCVLGNHRKFMWQTGTGHLIDLDEDTTSRNERTKRKWEPPTNSRSDPPRSIQMDDETGEEQQSQPPRDAKRPKKALNPSSESSSIVDEVNRQLQSPRGTKPSRRPPNSSSEHSSLGDDQKPRESQSVRRPTTPTTDSPAKSHRQSLVSVTDSSSVGEDLLNRQLQSPRHSSLISVPDNSSQNNGTASEPPNQPTPRVSQVNTAANRPTGQPITNPEQPSTAVEVTIIGQDTVDDQLSVLSHMDTRSLPSKTTTQTQSTTSINDDRNPQQQMPTYVENLQDQSSAQPSEEPFPASTNVTENQQRSQQVPSTPPPLPLVENLSDVVGLRQMIKIFAPDDEIANMITPWVSDIFLGKSTDQISSWIKEQHEVLRKLSLTPATLDKTTRWIQDCANVDALMIPGDFHTILSGMNPRDPNEMSDETLHKMPRDESGLYTELRSLVSFLSPNTDLSLYDLITLLCRELLESPTTMNFASHRLFQYVAARMFADENTLRDVSVMDQIASNLLHLFRLAASSYARRYLFSEYNIFTKHDVNTSSISEGSGEFGRMVRQSVFVQFLVPFFRRLREYQGMPVDY